MAQYHITLNTDAANHSKQQSRDHLQQLIDQLPQGYLLDILVNEESEFKRAIDNDTCFIDYRSQLEQQQEHRKQLAAINQEIEAARQQLKAKTLELTKMQNRMDDIEQTRRELRKLLAAV